jgi:hypothetical protein
MIRFLYFLSNSPRQYFHKRGAENVRFEASRIVPGGGFSLANTEKAGQSSIRKSDTTRRGELIVLMREPTKVDLSASAGCKQIWRRCSGCGTAKKPNCSREHGAHHCAHSYHFIIATWRAKEAESYRVKYWEIISQQRCPLRLRKRSSWKSPMSCSSTSLATRSFTSTRSVTVL